MVDHATAILEDKLAVGFKAGPEFLTSVTTVKGGYERRNLRRATAVWRFKFDGAEQSTANLATLKEFFIGRRGPTYSWLLKNWFDYQLDAEVALIAGTLTSAAGGETTAQIVKRYDVSGNGYTRTIKYIKSGTLKVFVDAVEDSGATETDGLITLSGSLSVGEVVTVGETANPTEYYFPARFTQDFAGLEMTSRSATYGRLPQFDAIEVIE